MKHVSTHSYGGIDDPPYRHAYFMDNHRWLSGENLFISKIGSAQIQDLQDSRFTLTDRLGLAWLNASMALDRTCCNEVVRLSDAWRLTALTGTPLSKSIVEIFVIEECRLIQFLGL
jgi:hypothetical protein